MAFLSLPHQTSHYHVIQMLIGLLQQMIEEIPEAIVFSLELISFFGLPPNIKLSLTQVLSLNIEVLPMQQLM